MVTRFERYNWKVKISDLANNPWRITLNCLGSDCEICTLAAGDLFQRLNTERIKKSDKIIKITLKCVTIVAPFQAYQFYEEKYRQFKTN